MKSWNTKVIRVEATQYGPRLIMTKKGGGEWGADMAQGVDVTAYTLPTELHVSFDDSGQFLKVVKVEPPKQRQGGGGGRGGGWRPEPPEKTALTTSAGIVKSALEGGHCKSAEDAVSWLNTVYPVALRMAKAAAPQAPAQAPQTAQPQQAQPAQGPQHVSQHMPPAGGYSEVNPPPADFDDDIPF